MILFSTLTQPYVLMLFCYLGLSCGIIFFIVSWVFSRFPKQDILKSKIEKFFTLRTNQNKKINKKVKNFGFKKLDCKLNDNEEQNERKKLSQNLKCSLNDIVLLTNSQENNTFFKDTKIELIDNTNKRDIKDKTSNNNSLKNQNKHDNLYQNKNQDTKQKINNKNLDKQEKIKLRQQAKREKLQQKAKEKQLRFQKRQQQKQKKLLKKQENKQKNAIRKQKLKQKLIVIITKICIIFSKIIKFVVFFSLIITCFYINLQINYGEINIISILVFVLSFFLARYFLKLLAKFLVNFYNIIIRRKKG